MRYRSAPPTFVLRTVAPPLFMLNKNMATVYLSRVDSSSKLDSRTGLPLGRDELGASQSSPVLQEGSTARQQDLSPLLDKGDLRPKSVRDSLSPEVTSSLKELGELERENEAVKRKSSFVDLLESRDIEMDQAWLDMQV